MHIYGIFLARSDRAVPTHNNPTLIRRIKCVGADVKTTIIFD